MLPPQYISIVKVWAIFHKKYILYRSVSIAITEKLSIMALVVWGFGVVPLASSSPMRFIRHLLLISNATQPIYSPPLISSDCCTVGKSEMVNMLTWCLLLFFFIHLMSVCGLRLHNYYVILLVYNNWI